MAEETRRYSPIGGEDEPIELNELLEPYDSQEQIATVDDYGDDEYGEPMEDAYGSSYDPALEEEEDYSDYHEELDRAGRLHTAMGIFDSVSMVVGMVVIFLLVAMLVSLISWLRGDIAHSLALLKSGIQ